MNLLQSLVRSSPRAERSWPSWDTVNVGGVTYPLHPFAPTQSLGFTQEEIDPSYTGLARSAFMGNGVVFACMEYRRKTFSQAHFQWQQVRGGTPGRLFGTDALSLLENPWPNAVTGDLLSRVIQDADLAGNAFVVRLSRDRLTVLRPDWVTIVAASDDEPDQGIAAIDAEIIGYAYWPGGKSYGQEPAALAPSEVAHFAPVPDPTARFRGIPWVARVIPEVMGDSAATTHKLKFFENGATPNLVVSLDPAITLEKFNAWVEKMDQKTKGLANAYKTLYLGAGAKPEVIGRDMRQIDFKVTQGAGETRIAAAAGVPPVLVGLSEGLAAATYSNYASARRSYSDTTLWELWANIAGSLESILPPPPGARLWVDTRHIPFMQEDEKDRAEIQQLDASAINTLTTAGYTPDSVVDAVTSGDLSRLVHSGLYSVQLQPAGAGQPVPSAQPPAGRALPMHLPAAGVDDRAALIGRARNALLARGIRPTAAAMAEELGYSDRTVRRWKAELTERDSGIKEPPWSPEDKPWTPEPDWRGEISANK